MTAGKQLERDVPARRYRPSISIVLCQVFVVLVTASAAVGVIAQGVKVGAVCFGFEEPSIQVHDVRIYDHSVRPSVRDEDGALTATLNIERGTLREHDTTWSEYLTWSLAQLTGLALVFVVLLHIERILHTIASGNPTDPRIAPWFRRIAKLVLVAGVAGLVHSSAESRAVRSAGFDETGLMIRYEGSAPYVALLIAMFAFAASSIARHASDRARGGADA